MKTTRKRNNKGQAMVEYIIIVVLIAITLIVLFSKFGKAIGEKVTGATTSLSEKVGDESKQEYQGFDEKTIKSLNEDGFQ